MGILNVYVLGHNLKLELKCFVRSVGLSFGMVFYICADCDLDLVDELSPLPEPEFVDYKEVLGTYNPADIAFLKSVLESEGIQYFFKGEHFMYVRPLADPVRLMVRTDQVQ